MRYNNFSNTKSNDTSLPLVSVAIVTFNHAAYIKKCIDSILSQQTNFLFDILIHDDASTDGTEEIVREYEVNFPDVIKPIYETENQWIKGRKGSIVFNYPRAQGKYIAFCEGDDYWTDPLKLQKQVKVMEEHHQISLCVHKVNRISATTCYDLEPIQPAECSRYFSIEDVIRGGGGLFGSNSILFRTSCLENYPKFLLEVPIEDYPLVIFMALKGDVFYINSAMSVYRKNVPGSWTMSNSNDPKKVILLRLKLIEMLNKLDEHTNFVFTKSIQEKILDYNFRILFHKKDYRSLFLPEYRHLLKSKYSFRSRVRLYLKANHILS